MTAALTGGGKTKLEILSKPVQVTVVESGQGRPALLNQSEGIFAAETGSVGAVSIGAYFSNMGGVGNGYRWQRAPDSGTPPSQTSSDWKDTIPAPRTIIGLGTPTLTFGISGAGAQVASTGWYRLIADNQYDVEVFSDPIRLIIQDTSKFGQPSVGIIGPRQGSVKGGTLVSVKGKNLVGASVVTFGGVAGWNVVVARSAADGSSDELTVITPAHAAGTVNLFIKTPGGSVTKAFTFT
ncbi:hypothetical protein RO07_16615 [Pandoraea pulmonicola]|nr:hypothetical protein RO07_16615 [Pandoraea pulmonicola]